MGKIKLDYKKTNEDYIREAEKFYIVPIIIRENYPQLIKMLVETASMNDEEQDYWLQILPIMNEEQITKLLKILDSEKQQVDDISQEYKSGMDDLERKHSGVLKQINLKEKLQSIKSQETAFDKKEEAKEQDLLNQLENL